MRLDTYLKENNYTTTRSKATHLIKTKMVLVNNELKKPSYIVKPTDKITIKEEFKYVSRGGYKLEDFISKETIKNKTILDVGCSNGGFTDFFQKNQAKHITAIDIADDILDKSLQSKPNITFHGNINILNKHHLESILTQPNNTQIQFDIISSDISNIKLEHFLENLTPYLKKDGFFILLFKPQYQGGKGIVNENKKEELTHNFELYLKSKNYQILKKQNSKIPGGAKCKGNIEVLYLVSNKINICV
jgi:23S rRNA (cytidine1920-2'-O)/16S rRNA (cytidine1409-2'-O)-methyltransferase